MVNSKGIQTHGQIPAQGKPGIPGSPATRHTKSAARFASQGFLGIPETAPTENHFSRKQFSL
jgi:hypothetical protein